MITTNPQILDQVTQEFLTALKNDGLIIQGATSGLFYYLATIQLALTSIWMVLSGEPLHRFLANLVKLSFSFGFFMPDLPFGHRSSLRSFVRPANIQTPEKSMILKNSYKIIAVLLILLSLTGCAHRPIVKYNPDDFTNPNHIITKQVKVQAPTSKINASFGIGDNPKVVKAYQEFTKKGVAQNINAQGFRTIAYSAYERPVIACAPLHLCVIQLERGEKINNIDLGDSAHWKLDTSLVGSKQNGSYQITIRPKLFKLATDIVITTNKRFYYLRLVSMKGANTEVINYYYPEETLQQAIAATYQQQNSPITRQVINNSTHINLNHLNFNYAIKGDHPAWQPVRVFDDGNKTFISMPPVGKRLDLPVLYILKNHNMALVNYRYKQLYYIIDGLFQKAFLITGKGREQQRVEIDNENF